MKAKARRLSRLEARRAAAVVERPPLTEDELTALIVEHVRDRGLTHDGSRWVAVVGRNTEHDCTILAEGLNQAVGENPGWLLMPLTIDECDAARAALDAGRFWLSETNYMSYRWVNINQITGTPLLTGRGMTLDGVMVGDDYLASDLQLAGWIVHQQTGAPMPATLEDFGVWLHTWSPYALSVDLEHGASES